MALKAKKTGSKKIATKKTVAKKSSAKVDPSGKIFAVPSKAKKAVKTVKALVVATEAVGKQNAVLLVSGAKGTLARPIVDRGNGMVQACTDLDSKPLTVSAVLDVNSDKLSREHRMLLGYFVAARGEVAKREVISRAEFTRRLDKSSTIVLPDGSETTMKHIGAPAFYNACAWDKVANFIEFRTLPHNAAHRVRLVAAKAKA